MCADVPETAFDTDDVGESCPFSNADFGPCSNYAGIGTCRRHKMEIAVYVPDKDTFCIQGTEKGVRMLRYLNDETSKSVIKPISVCAFHKIRTSFIFKHSCACGGQKFLMSGDFGGRSGAWKFYGDMLYEVMIGDSACDFCCYRGYQENTMHYICGDIRVCEDCVNLHVCS